MLAEVKYELLPYEEGFRPCGKASLAIFLNFLKKRVKLRN